MMQHTICMICDRNTDNKYYPMLLKMQRLLESSHVEPVKGRYEHLPWSINIRCEYGISCDKLKDQEQKARRLASELEPYIIAASQRENDALYHNVLHLLQGYFPAVYLSVERYHHKKKG